VGNTITIADISLAVSMVELYRLLIDNKMREALPNVTRWYRHVLSLPPLVEVMGVVAYCEEEHKMDFKATQRSHIRLNIPTRS
jgi:elongation factor 1-gamma